MNIAVFVKNILHSYHNLPMLMNVSVSHFWTSGFGLPCCTPIPGMHKLLFWNKDSYVLTTGSVLFLATQVVIKANASESYLWPHSSYK